VADEQVGQLGLADLPGGHVQLEPLGLQATTVGEGHLGVEDGAVLGHVDMLPHAMPSAVAILTSLRV
jgi:hypothetical protein